MKYLLINVDDVPHDEVFQTALKKCVDGEIIGSINAGPLNAEEIRAEIVGKVDGNTDIIPVLLYEDTGWGEDETVPACDFVIVGAVAALATGNITNSIDYCSFVEHKRGYRYWILQGLNGKRIKTENQPLPITALSPYFLRRNG